MRYEVVEFSGYAIRYPTPAMNYWRGGPLSTDFHIVDERGRTVKVYRTGPGLNRARRRDWAERYCSKLNAR